VFRFIDRFSPMPVARTLSRSLYPLLLLSLVEPSAALPAQAEQSEQTVVFDVRTVSSTRGESSEPKPLLTIELRGQPVDQEIMVILEGDGVGRTMVPMSSDADPGAYSARVVLDALPTGPPSSPPNLLRIEATFAKLHGMRLVRFLTRPAYVTLRPSGEGGGLQTATIPLGSSVGEPEPVQLESRPDVPAMPDGAIAETDLVVRPPPSALSGYWGEVKRLMNRSWRQQLKSGPRSERGGVARVRFRLLPDGHVPLIQIERSSGNPRLDEVALKSVVSAQPFPPFPAYLQDDSVDVHIDLRPGR
jgi:TonB family protein